MTQSPSAAFLEALQHGDTGTAHRLLLETPSITSDSIHAAAAVADVESVRAFLATNPALATQPLPGSGLQPLLYAVDEELKRELGVSRDAHVTTVRLLLDAGADANSTAPLPDGSDTIPALFFPCVSGNADVARLLLERGAQATDGESIYHAAQHDQRECLTLLHDFGADLSHGPTIEGNTPLHFLASHTPQNSISASVLRGMAWLLEHGADPAVTSHHGRTGHPQAGETPLHRVAAVGHDAAILRALVAHGAPVNAQRDDGATAYRLAVRGGHASTAAALAALGADTTVTTIDKLLDACHRGDDGAACALVAAEPDLIAGLDRDDRDALSRAAGDGRADVVRVMCAIGWPLTDEGEWGGTPLHWAAWHGRSNIVRVLLERGAPVNARDTCYGSSPLAWAAHGSHACDGGGEVDHAAVVHLLLDAGATRAASFNQWNESPESMASARVVQVLRERGFLDG